MLSTIMKRINHGPYRTCETIQEGFSGSKTPFPIYSFNEENKTWDMEFEMPGIPKENLKVSTSAGFLLVKGKTETRNYSKKMRLDPRIDLESINAQLNNGLLTISMKMKKIVEKEIPINGIEAQSSNLNITEGDKENDKS